ncbi:MAG: DNA/RNA nuclease SfsA [Halieaceae bacterium]|jgi:sugar fermentation stimulation protein A|nr:DNA/RNA nuclease SfsA [Halieaceae bacterium]
MEFSKLTPGTLERRYKRFLADIVLADGRRVTAHCPNTGAMTGLTAPGLPVWLSESDNPARKLRWTLELVETDRGMVCVHSALANKVVGEALREQRIEPLAGGWKIRSEVRLPGSARIDFVLSQGEQRVVVEVKAVTLLDDGGLGLFPDARSERAQKHAEALAASVSLNTRAVLLYCVFHTGIERVSPALDIDPAYAGAVLDAVAAGVEVLACACAISPGGIEVTGMLPVEGVAN